MKNKLSYLLILILLVLTFLGCDKDDAEEISETKVYKDPYAITVIVDEIYDDYFTGTGYYDSSYKYKIYYQYDGTYAEGDLVHARYLKIQETDKNNYQFFALEVELETK